MCVKFPPRDLNPGPYTSHPTSFYTSVVDTVPYRPVRPEYTVPAGDPVRLTPTFRTGKNTGCTGLVPAVLADTGQYRPVQNFFFFFKVL